MRDDEPTRAPPLVPDEKDLFWAHAAAFGALWGAIEATLGSYLHALEVPFAGTVLAATGAALLVALRTVHPRRGVVLAAGLVSAGVKVASPATVVIGPVVGILVESLLVEVACVAGPSVPAAAVAGALATSWALTQKVLTQIVLYGAPIVTLYRDVLRRAEQWLALSPGGGIRLAIAFGGFVAAGGAIVSSFGLRVGRSAIALRNARPR